MNQNKLIYIVCLLVCSISSFGQNPLFNGKSLAGWHTDVPERDTNAKAPMPFIIRNGNLVSLGEPRGHLITDKEYSNYRLEMEYRFVGAPGNCGILVHASLPRALYRMFPQSIEVQLEHENAGDFWVIREDIMTSNMEKRRGDRKFWGTIEGKLRRIMNLTDGTEKPLGEWNKLAIECFGNDIKVWVNDVVVNYGTQCTTDHGQIAIQAEGAEVEFKDITLKQIEAISK